MYSGGVEPRPYDVVGVGLCSTRIGSQVITLLSPFPSPAA